jgi:hypothetical protein
MEIFEFSTIQMRNTIKRTMLQQDSDFVLPHKKLQLKEVFKPDITNIAVLVITNVVLWVVCIITLMHHL